MASADQVQCLVWLPLVLSTPWTLEVFFSNLLANNIIIGCIQHLPSSSWDVDCLLFLSLSTWSCTGLCGSLLPFFSLKCLFRFSWPSTLFFLDLGRIVRYFIFYAYSVPGLFENGPAKANHDFMSVKLFDLWYFEWNVMSESYSYTALRSF